MKTEFHWIISGPHRLAASVDRPDTLDPCPVVIAIHGLTGHRMGPSYLWLQFSRALTAEGFAVVRFDQSGCGESTGEFIDHTIPRMVGDVTAVADWTLTQPWCAELFGYAALSLGALAAVAADAHRPAQALALWAPVFDMPRVFAKTAKTGLQALLQYQGWVPYRGQRVGKPFVDQLAAVDPSTLLAHSPARVLLCHSRVDEVVGFEESESYDARCRELERGCKLLAFDDANHDFLNVDEREALMKHTVRFMIESQAARDD